MKTYNLEFGYIVSIVTANLLVQIYGPKAIIPVSLILIGLDLTLRDKLHDRWANDNLKSNMGKLILLGSGLTYLINNDAGTIALASVLAFFFATLIDTIVYHALRNKAKLIQINGSNIFSALADSVIFPTVAFWQFIPAIVIGQFISKTLGGYLWSLVLVRVKK